MENTILSTNFNINIIAAMSLDHVIGSGGHMPWRQDSDLKQFSLLTRDQTVVLGSGTIDCIGGKPLPNRHNIILTRKTKEEYPEYHIAMEAKGFTLVNHIDEAVLECETEELWVIGGQEVYEAFMPYADYIFLTKLYTYKCGDKFFPRIPFEEYRLEEIELCKKAEGDDCDMVLEVYKRYA